MNYRQAAFIHNFLSPDSDTRGNYHKSALKAGYNGKYQPQVRQGVQKAISKDILVSKAEEVLRDCLDFQDDDNRVGAARIRQDTSKFILASTSKYSSKQETRVDVSGIEEARRRIGRILEDKEELSGVEVVDAVPVSNQYEIPGKN